MNYGRSKPPKVLKVSNNSKESKMEGEKAKWLCLYYIFTKWEKNEANNTVKIVGGGE